MLDAVVLDDVRVVRGGRTVWSDGSFRVPRGAVVIVIGPNGSGKTTLLQLMLGLVEPATGAVSVLGATPTAAARGSGTCRRTTPRTSATRSGVVTS